MAIEIGKEAQGIIRRLAAVDRVAPRVDRRAAEVALTLHFEALGLACPPIRWLEDAESGYGAAESAARSAALSAARSAAESAARSAALSAAWSAAWSAAESAARSAAWSAAESAAESAAWSAAWSAARSAAWSAAESAALSAALSAAWSAAWSAAESAARSAAWSAARSAAWSAAESAAESAAWSAAESAAWSAAWSAAESAAWSAAESAAESAAWSAAESAAWSAAWSAAESAAIDRWIGIWMPFVDAYEAGLWLFWIFENEVLAVPRPALQIAGERLHCADGPAVSWPNGKRYWFWNGVQVPQDVIESPTTITVKRIDEETNVEVRRAMLERFGVTRWLTEGGSEEIHRDETGVLYRKARLGDTDVFMVRVECPSTGHTFFLRVHPQLRPMMGRNQDGRPKLGRAQNLTARNAVASTFGKSGGKYRPGIET